MVIGLAFSTLGASRSPAPARQPVSNAHLLAIPVDPGDCPIQTVRITLASEQVAFCAPSSLPYDVVEDSTSDPNANYAGLSQLQDYGILTIKAILPGNRPGPGRPVYLSGEAAIYRLAVMNQETAKTDRLVSNGPAAIFWNESIPGIQEDLTLSLSTGNLQVRSIEWVVVHNGRLWSFNFAWDIGMQNAGDWQAASRNFSVDQPDEKSGDTASDLGAAFLAFQPSVGISPQTAPIDVNKPAWWNGSTCDDASYYAATGVHSIVLGSVWHHGVYACGTNPMSAMVDRVVQFFPGAWGEYEFECVELVMRFLYQEWGIAPFSGNGNTIKANAPASMVFYKNDGSRGIVPGDVITENASAQNSAGHTMVVTAVSLDVTGTGTVNILEQNASSAGQRSLNVVNGQIQPDTWCWGQTIQGWLHVKGNQDDGNVDPTFVPVVGSDKRISAVALKPTSQKILIAGDFTAFDGTSINEIARLNTDGTLDSAYNPKPGVTAAAGDTPSVDALAVYTDGDYKGKALIGGHFTNYNNASPARAYIARLNSDGSLDTSFTPAAAINADVYKIVIVNPADAASKILVGGAGILHQLLSNGTRDTSFVGTMDSAVRDIAIQPDGKIVIGGSFSKVDGINRAGIARLSSTGLLDATFNPGTGTGTETVKTLSLDPDGRVLIGGTFSAYNDTSRNKVARLNADGSLDTTFDPGTGFALPAAVVRTILAQSDGRVLIGGDFSSYNGNSVNFIARLSYSGSLDTSFSSSLDGGVQAMLLQPDGKVLVVGDFTKHVNRLINNVESCYALTTQASPPAGGSLLIDPAPNCPGNKYLSGTQVQLTVVLNPNYWLLNWSGDGSGSTNPLVLNLDANKAVTANLMASPAAFNKVSPANGAPSQPASLTLSWGTSDGASSYEYCLDKSTNGTCDNSWVTTGTNTSVTVSNLTPSVTYSWQVRARNAVDTTDSGAWWSFTRDGIPGVPVTLSPHSIISDHTPAYVWNASSGATSYHVTVYSIDSAANVIDDDPVTSSSICSGGLCTYHPSVELPFGNYQFRVSATAGGTSSPSPWKSFTVGLGIFLPFIP
jgi:uncharacterized delta-60 repeat protein